MQNNWLALKKKTKTTNINTKEKHKDIVKRAVCHGVGKHLQVGIEIKDIEETSSKNC